MSVFCCHHHCHFRRHVLRKYMQCRHLTVNLRHRCGGRIIAFASGETVPVSLLLLSSTASVYLKLPKNHCVLYSELGVHLDSLEGTLLLPNCSMYENDFGTAHTHSSTGHLFFVCFFCKCGAMWSTSSRVLWPCLSCSLHRLDSYGWWLYIPHNESVVCFGIACKWRSISICVVVETTSLLQISVGNVPIAFRGCVLPVLLFRQGS